MPRPLLILLIVLVVIVVVLFGLSTLGNEVPTTRVEQPVTNAAAQ